MSKSTLFADDTNVHAKDKILVKLKPNSTYRTWKCPPVAYGYNKLTTNEEKTEFMLIGSRSRLASIDNNPVLTVAGRRIKRA